MFSVARMLLIASIGLTHLCAVAEELSRFPRELSPAITYEHLCSYDGYCKKLRDERTKEFVRPQRMSLSIFQRFRSTVFAIAKKYNVDPVVLIAVITTEHTLNVNIADVWLDILVSTPLDSDGSFAGVNFSYGFGQIYADAIAVAEKIVARVEGRDELPVPQLEERLKTMEGALNYAAALLVNATEAYRQAGLQIDDNPGVLATLYNIGKIEERIARTKQEGRAPGLNYFGWFVLKNWSDFYDALFTEQNTFKLSPKMLEEAKISSTTSDLYPVFQMGKSAKLFLRPERCQDFDNRKIVANESIARSDSGTGGFEILNQSLDCNGKEWSLVRMLNGEVGWLNNSEIEKSVSFDYVTRSCQAEHKSKNCFKRIKNIDPRIQVLKEDLENGELEIQLLAFGDEKPDISYYDSRCNDENFRNNIQKRTNEEMARDEERKKKTFRESIGAVYRERDELKFRRESEAIDQKQIQNIFAETGYKIGLRTPAERRLIIDMVEAKKKELLTTLGYNSIDELDYGSLRELAYRLDILGTNEFESRRRDFALMPSVEDYRRFLDGISILDLLSRPTLTKELAKRFNNIRSARADSRVMIGQQKESLELKQILKTWEQTSFENNWRKIRQNCDPIFKKIPGALTASQPFIDSIEMALRLPEIEQVKPSSGRLRQAANTCSALAWYLDWTAQGKPSAMRLSLEGELESVEIILRSAGQLGAPVVNLKHLRFLKLSSEEISTAVAFLLEQLSIQIDRLQTDLKQWSNPKPRKWWRTCGYDPIATSDLVEKVSGESCVVMVQIPDERTLITRVALANKKIVGYPQSMQDRFRVVIKPRCDYD